MKWLKGDEHDGSDVALIHGRTPDGAGLRIVRRREDRVEVGALHPLKHGTPIVGEVVSLTPRPDFPLLCDVKVELPAPVPQKAAPARVQKGPAQVATDRYRENWDRIFEPKKSPPLLN